MLEHLGDLYRRWPFFALGARQRGAVARQGGPRRRSGSTRTSPSGDEAAAIRANIEAEFARSVRLLLLVTGRDRLLAGHATLARSIVLRNPYVDALSAIQVELLGRLRRAEAAGEPAAATAPIRAVIGATINGIAAGLQNTG